MNIFELVKKEYMSLSLFERTVFPFVTVLIAGISVFLKDNPVALCSAIFGISYTVLAGKGRIYCYFFGICATLCYSVISFKNALYGNFILNAFYYLPGQIVGIFKWKKHLKKNTYEIKKTRLKNFEPLIYSIISAGLILIVYFVFSKIGDKNPVADSVTTVLSVVGLVLTVKRCIEQWYVWFIVNLCSVLMWIDAYLRGSGCFATILMWSVYLYLAVYFLKQWKNESGS